jgi:ribonuclease III
MRSLFRDPALFDQAVTHRSWAVEHGVGDDNERLEFLGDAVLQICVTRLLYERHPQAREGELSQTRARVVNTRQLAQVARDLGIAKDVRLGRGEEVGGGRDRDRLLAGVYEAVLGALYLDSGIDAAFVNVASWIDRATPVPTEGAKNQLQEWAQGKKKTTPVYDVEHSEGPPHAPRFVVVVKIDGEIVGRGEGRSKQLASHAAAADALTRITL